MVIMTTAVTIKNKSGELMTVHKYSGDDDCGESDLPPDEAWNTEVNHNIWGNTVVIAKILNDDGDKAASFAVAGGDANCDRVHVFVLRPDGVYRDGKRIREWNK